MSRWIVQLAATATAVYEPGAGVSVSETLYALDNNGVAWMLDTSRPTVAKWHRLPALPSLEIPRPQPTADFETPKYDKDGHDFPAAPALTPERSNGTPARFIAPIGDDTE